jgi:hypothetical protein
MFKTAAAAAALAITALGGVTASLAGGYGWRPYDFWQSNWRAAYLSGQWDGVVHTGAFGPGVGQAVLGKYPYHDYGYNNGTCIGYELVCDAWGHVIGRRPALVC